MQHWFRQDHILWVSFRYPCARMCQLLIHKFLFRRETAMTGRSATTAAITKRQDWVPTNFCGKATQREAQTSALIYVFLCFKDCGFRNISSAERRRANGLTHEHWRSENSRKIFRSLLRWILSFIEKQKRRRQMT